MTPTSSMAERSLSTSTSAQPSPVENRMPVGDSARRPASSLWDRFAEALRRFFGEVEFTIGSFCAICDDVHGEGTKCVRAMLGRCLDCASRWRALDRFGNCGVCGSSSVVKRMLRYPNARKRACCDTEAPNAT